MNKAFRSGRLVFHNGRVTGKFTAATTKELNNLGATWKGNGFIIPIARLHSSTQSTIETSLARFNKRLESINKKIAAIVPEEIAKKIDVTQMFDKQIFETNKEITDQVKTIRVNLQLDDEQRLTIATQYNANMELYIRKWTEEEIFTLRDLVQKNYASGNRTSYLAKEIQKRRGVSDSKAKFLARQETHLLHFEVQKQTFIDAGSERYIWKTVVGSPKHPVRPFHEKLDGTIQYWDKPPIDDEKGNRHHPGQNFNCRCFARPLLTIDKREEKDFRK